MSFWLVLLAENLSRKKGTIMIAIVDEETCTGCGLCADTCPEVFELVDDLAKVIADPVPDDVEEACRDAADECPVEAISLED